MDIERKNLVEAMRADLKGHLDGLADYIELLEERISIMEEGAK